jgi:hypothetical protein
MSNEPFFGITYGPPGTGKTLAILRAFPKALFLSPKGGMSCAHFIGVRPVVDHPTSIANVTAMLKAAKSSRDYPTAIVIDDFSLLADAELRNQKQSCKDKWGAFDLFNHEVYDLRDAARDCPFPVIFTMHEKPPRTVGNEEGRRAIPGCPLIEGWQLPEKLPAYCDFVARIVYDKHSLSGWPYVYQIGPDPDYITKNRIVNAPDRFPLNLRVMLLAAGYDLPRPKEFAWMEKIVKQTVPFLQPILQNKDKEELHKLLTKVFKQLITKHSSVHARWALMDAIDTANLTNHQATLGEKFIIDICKNLGETNDLFI